MHGDLTKVACHDVVVPVDRHLNVTPVWAPLTGATHVDERWAKVPKAQEPAGWGQSVHSFELVTSPDPNSRVWLLDAERRHEDPLQYLLAGVREVLGRVADAEPTELTPPRARRLVGIPLPGVGTGGYAGEVGGVVSAILDALEVGAERGLDVALVLKKRSHYAAVQHVRAQRASVAEVARRPLVHTLADKVRRQELAVFLGAGVSIAAGLPSWEDLLTRLEQLNGLTTPCAITLTARADRLDDTSGGRLTTQVKQVSSAHDKYALAHGLIAGWGVREVVTTNYDTNYEDAVRATEPGDITVLPRERANGSSGPWVLKVHGDLGDESRDLVLSTRSYEDFGTDRGPLGAIFQSLLMLRHVLFIGYGLGDQNLLDLAGSVRRMLAAHLGSEPAGTVLHLRSSTVADQPLSDLLTAVASDSDVSDDLGAARELEILLDEISLVSTTDAPFLLDDTFGSLVNEPADVALKAKLRSVAESGAHHQSRYWPLVQPTVESFGG